jgi:glyoxylate carboligase
VAQNTAQFMLGRLADWGVKRIYGYPGDGINGLLGAFHKVGDRIEFTQTAHEEIAAFAATAHAKVTGEVGVCMATSGSSRSWRGLLRDRIPQPPARDTARRRLTPRCRGAERW